MKEQTASKVPQIRFKGVEGDWEEKNVSEICGDTYGGGTPRTSERKFWEGEIPWIQSSDITDGEIYRVAPRKYISGLALRNSPTKLVPGNSIAIVTRVGVGKLALIEFSYAASQDFLSLSKLKVDQSFAAVALSILLQSKLHETQGTSIKGITKEELLAYSFTIPHTIAEQQKIGTHFRELDRLIGLHQRKHDKLLTLKKAMLQKMFPQRGATTPEIRFKGFSVEWVEKILGEVCAIGDADHWMPETTSHGIPYVMTGDFCGINEIDFDNAKLISLVDFEKLSKKIKPEFGDILFARYASIGSVRYVNTTREFIASYSCAILKSSSSFNSEYLFYLIQTDNIQNQLKQSINTGSQGNVGIESLKNLAMLFPDKVEQQKIGLYFRTLDSLISKHATQLQKLKQIKSACLEKMFV